MIARVINQAKRVANTSLVGVCVLFAYRRSMEMPLVDAGFAPDGVKQWRHADTGECAASAILHGTILADKLTKAFSTAWRGDSP